MEVEVKEKSPNEIHIYVRGETYTLLVPIAEELNSMDDVEFAGYDVPHPLKEEGILYLRVREGKDPRSILKEAVGKIIEEYENLEKSFKEELDAFLSGG